MPDTETLEDLETTDSLEADDSPAEIESTNTAPADDVSGGESVQAPVAETGASPISAEMQSLAKNYGLEPEHFGSDENIRRAVVMLDRQAAEWAKASPQWQERTKAVPSQPSPLTPPPQQSAPTQFDFDKLFPKDQIDETLTGSLRQLYDHLNGELGTKTKGIEKIEALEKRLNEMTEFHEARSHEEAVSAFDSKVQSLGKEWQETFGSGPMEKLPPGSPLIAARNQLWDQCHLLAHADALRGRKVQRADFYLDAALRSAFSQQTDNATRQKVLTDLKQRKGSALPRGNTKSIQPVGTPEERVKAMLRAKLKQNNFYVDALEEDE